VASSRTMHLDGNTQGAGRGDAYNAFLDQAGQPLPAPPTPEPPGGCLPSVMSLLRR